MKFSVVQQLPVLPLSRICRALGDETRVRIVALLSHGELCVCHVQEALGLAQPTASRQLLILKGAGVVDSRRDGTWVYYRLAEQLDDGSKRLLKALVAEFSKHVMLRKDVARLLATRGPNSCA